MQGELVVREPTIDELMDDLTDLQRRFVEALIESPDIVYAYRVAGGKAKRADHVRVCAYEILVNPNVQKVLRRVRKERMDRTLITSDWVLNKLVQVIERCMQGQPVLDDDGKPTGEWKFDSAGATKALQLMMKHLGMFERDNRQKAPKSPDEMRERLRQMGMDPARLVALPPGQ